MNQETNCEVVRMAKMAELDGEEHVLDSGVERHLAGCENCRQEVAAMQDLNGLFRTHRRAEREVHIWPQVKEQISAPARSPGWQPFALVAAALVAFKFVEMSLRDDPGYLFGLVPLAVATALFIVLKENPFKVNTDLVME